MGLCVAANVEQSYGCDDGELDIGDRDVELIAAIRYGEVTPATLDRASRGCGVMVEYRRGRGRVVSIGSAEWVNGLRVGDAGVEQVTRNVLDTLLAGAR